MAGNFNGGIVIAYDKFAEVAGKAEEAIDKAAREFAFELLARAMEHLTEKVYTRPNTVVTSDDGHTPEPTGALMNSGYVRTSEGEELDVHGSPYDPEAAATARNPNVRFGVAPDIANQKGRALVLFAVEYALYVEMGTVRMASRSFLLQAAWDVEASLPKIVRACLLEAGFEA